MKSNTVVEKPNDEIFILEMVAVIAEAWKFLVFIPLLVGIAIFSASYFTPGQYEASASIALSKAQADKVGGAAFFNDLVRKVNLPNLRRDVKISTTAAGDSITFVAIRATASEAEDLLYHAITEATVEIDDLTPSAKVRRLQSELAALKENELILRTALDSIQNSVVTSDSDVRQLVILANEIKISTVRRESVEFVLADALDPVEENVAESVTPQVRRLGTRPEILAGMSFMATFLLLLIGVFSVDALKREMANPRAVDSVARIKRAFRRFPKDTVGEP